GPDHRNTPIGILRQTTRPTYDNLVQHHITTAQNTTTHTPEQQLTNLLHTGDTWTIRALAEA
ncbi:2-oxoacid:ferredoxin oxidoreductase subunit beta, partial [Micromonospora rifamycinica]